MIAKSSSKILLALVALLALAAVALLVLPARPAHAQATGNGKIEGQIVQGTKNASLEATQGVTLTLYQASATATSPVSSTGKTDANGRFAFSSLETISSTRYLVIANYKDVDYYSYILAFDQNLPTIPVTVTVFETTEDPSAVKVSQMHVVFDVQTKVFGVTQILAIQNSTDRTYIGAAAGGPHRVTLPLTFLPGAQNIQFDNPAADSTTFRGEKVMSYTLPIPPGNDQIVYNYEVPFTPPNYQMNLALPHDADKVRLFVSDVGGTIASSQLNVSTDFPTQGGQKFILASGDNFKAGTVLNATFSNLPATVAGSQPNAPGSTTATPTAPADNSVIFGAVILGAAALGAVALLLYPVLRRRRDRAARQVSVDGERLELLQAIADLDDEFEANKITEEEYRERRSALKAQLLEQSQTKD